MRGRDRLRAGKPSVIGFADASPLMGHKPCGGNLSVTACGGDSPAPLSVGCADISPRRASLPLSGEPRVMRNFLALLPLRHLNRLP